MVKNKKTLKKTIQIDGQLHAEIKKESELAGMKLLRYIEKILKERGTREVKNEI